MGRPIQPSTQPDNSGRQMGMISQGRCNEVTVTLSLSGKRLQTEHNKAINKWWKISKLILSHDFSMMHCALQNKSVFLSRLPVKISKLKMYKKQDKCYMCSKTGRLIFNKYILANCFCFVLFFTLCSNYVFLFARKKEFKTFIQ